MTVLDDFPPENKPGHTPFWMFYTSDWASGVIGFTLEQEAFYLRVLLRMWERKAGLPDDIKWLSAALSCDPRKVRRLRSFLINQRKLRLVDGLLINPRAMRDIQLHQTRLRAKIGRTSGEDQPDLPLKFAEKPNDFYARARADQSQSQSQKDRSAFQPTVIEGGKTYTTPRIHDVSDQALNLVSKIAPGWDRQMLRKKFLDWPKSRTADDLDGAFLGWVKKFTKGKAAS